MRDLNDSFIKQLEKELFKLPSYTEQLTRNDSWMTSREIAQCFSAQGYGDYDETDIENFLLDKLKNNRLNNIRPAKYPNLLSMHTLWGHTQRTYPVSEESPLWKTDNKYDQLKPIALPEDAPSVFLSHSAKDFELAKKVRQTFGEEYGFDTWLFESKIDKDENIFGSVKLGIIHCDAVVLLLTPHSLGSAWISTEAQVSNQFYKKKILTLIDADDKDLLLLIAGNYETFDNAPVDLLERILEKYKLLETKENRINNFRRNAAEIFGFLHLYSHFSLFPSTEDNNNNRFIELRESLRDLKNK